MARRDAGAGSLPNLIVIGAQKCGTSSLHYYLGLHPRVQMSAPKELWFFVDPEDVDAEPYLREPRERVLIGGRRNWARGLDWYRGHFDPRAAVRGESTPGYASPWFPGVAERMRGAVPDARLIFLARDPIERMVSHYVQLRKMGREWRPIDRALGGPESVYLGRSRYARSLRPFLESYPAERILFLRQEELRSDRRRVVGETFAFLGLEDFWDPRMERERHPSEAKGRRHELLIRIQESPLSRPLYRLPQEVKWGVEKLAYRRTPEPRPELSPELERELRERLAPDIAELEGITGWDLSDWKRAT